ncbi:MAG: hypothetical protein ABWX82_01930 [Leifsonia sp.]
MTTLFWILVGFAAIVVASIATVVLIARAVYKRIRRSHTVNGAVLRNRARFSWGQQRRILGLRVRLRQSLDSGRSAIDIAVRSDGRRGELPRLFRRIESEGLVLDTRLRLLESETDASALAAEIPAAELRVDQVADMVRRLRASVASGLGDPGDDSITGLRSDIDREVAALNAGVVELRRLNGHDAPVTPIRQQSPDRLQTKGATS